MVSLLIALLLPLSAHADFLPNRPSYGRGVQVVEAVAIVLCDSTSSAIVSDPDNMILSIANRSGAVCGGVFESGFFASAPLCTCNRHAGSSPRIGSCEVTAATTYEIAGSSDTGADANIEMTLHCVGVR